MVKYLKIFCLIFIISNSLIFDPYKQLDIDFLKTTNKKNIKKKKIVNKKSKSSLPKYSDIIQDYAEITGLWNFYYNSDKNKLLLSLEPKHLETEYMMNITRQSGDAYYYGSSAMLNEFPFIFKQVGENIQMIHVNVLFRADKDKSIAKAVENDFSNSIIATTKIISQKQDSTNAVLIDANKLFIRDISYISQRAKGRYIFDAKNSSFIDIDSFDKNIELEISAYYSSKKSTNSYTLPNSRSMEMKYHLSIMELLKTDFIPRPVDDRIGYFSTIYQDYSNTLQESQYVRYIQKWNLVKKDPYSELSEPVEPIVYWIENTVPEEFRDAIKEGIEAWNIAFEAIGFKNAIVAKQMPDDANWNPADIRYNTIRWFIQPGAGYAVGPSRANPYTGQLYDADIRISADFVTSFYREFDEYVVPITEEEIASLWHDHDHHNHGDHESCNYSEHLKREMAYGWNQLLVSGGLSGTQEDLERYVHQGLVDLVLHEVGHTLGLRHNFKGSSIYSVEQLSDKNFTQKYGISGSVMDYHPVCLLDGGHTLFQTKPGPYDMWAIQYGYEQFNSNDLLTNLENIALQSNHPLLVYGTDEDSFGTSSKGIDPLCNVWDMSNNPIEFYKDELEKVNYLWDNLLNKFEIPGGTYQKIRSVFSQGIGEYMYAGRSATKFIGGINFSRNHIGDISQQNPFTVVDSKSQREALDFILVNYFDKNAFDFNPELLNKLAPERNEDFQGYVWTLDRPDYPIHSVVKRMQMYPLYSLYHPRRLARVKDNELKNNSTDIFRMEELFTKVNDIIWQELELKENINSYKRELQIMHITMLSNLLYKTDSMPADAIAFGRSSLNGILKDIYISMSNNEVDYYTKSHLEYCSKLIEAVLNPEIQIN